MDLLVLCPCGHPQGMHSASGCRAGRLIPCPCPLRPDQVIDEAIRIAQTATRFRVDTDTVAESPPAPLAGAGDV